MDDQLDLVPDNEGSEAIPTGKIKCFITGL